MTTRLAEEWFATCAGCEVSILDIGEPLLDLLQQVQIVHMPVLMDHKLFGQTGEKQEMEIPEADVGLISGSIRTREHKEIAREMRRKSKVLIALGSCACYGGIPALANLSTTEEILSNSYNGNRVPSEDLPPLTDRVYAIGEVVPVDLSLPGCPTTPEMVADALTALLEGRPFTPPAKSVCDACPLIRQKKSVTTLRRNLESPEPTHCLMEQGFLCLGAVTRAGCGGSQGTPRCIRAHMTCEGCFGPLTEEANPMVDMMTALSTIGVDPRQIWDRAATFNRFCGAGRLHPVKRK